MIPSKPGDSGFFMLFGLVIGTIIHAMLVSKIGAAKATGVTTTAIAGGYLAGRKFEEVSMLSPFSLGVGLGETANVLHILVDYLLEEKTE